ncbi:DUF4383 domain-containing protein [Deinococcus pimensis]|uniref:DUF4383 domain-containing protein n=1 Tax=Deinococcus pimensis TaxID=309888 RepID=UPI0004ADDB17|nr:DUF4383 domain-containing protein [Deinococcus pimensis]
MVRPYAAWTAVTLLLLGTLGLFPGPVSDAGLLLGLFPVSPTLCVLYLLLGLMGLYASRHYRDSAAFARTLTAVFGVLAFLAVLPVTSSMPHLAPLTRDPLWLVGVTAAVTAYFGWGAPSRDYIKLL